MHQVPVIAMVEDRSHDNALRVARLGVAEVMLPVYERALRELLRALKLPSKEAELTVDQLADEEPIRIHERAIDDFLISHNDAVIPEACVTDILRARIECHSGAAMSALLSRLAEGVDVPTSGGGGGSSSGVGGPGSGPGGGGAASGGAAASATRPSATGTAENVTNSPHVSWLSVAG